MYANYHTHSYHCHHAGGTPEDYVQAAIRRGMQIIGFSDHVPYPFSNGHCSGFRMDPQEHGIYVQELQELRKRYRDQIQIYIGYEAEYYPKEFPAMVENLNQYPWDYLILGQHFTQNEYDGVYSGGKKADEEEHLVQYVNQIIEGLETGYFSCVTHPDLIYYRQDPQIYRREMERLCRKSIELQIPLEVNFLGLGEGRAYPYEPFWQIAGEMQAPVIFGCDAHRPEALLDEDTYQKACRLQQKYHLNLQETLAFRHPGKGTAL